MARLLYVEASPRKQRSASIEVARAFLAAYRAAHPDDEIETLDLWAADLPEFDGAALEAKYAGLSGTPLTEAQETAWRRIRELAQPFHAADRLLFAVPLWNFGIPYRLKHLIDIVSQKDVLFSFTEQGFSGLLPGRKAAVIYARGLDYGPAAFTPAAGFDFQRPYMEMWLRFIGITDITAITVEKTLFGPEVDTGARAEAKIWAEAVAKTF
ncbi:FMN-dependent NADH-azoreductase [Inquilinus sp. NPDC058860]|uniref:FMN-dependent NADH-azoreductase n=1 Tax=Inquilinus sp. NPDC058860 TaxID=3346652 RepID=UPI0036A8DB27